MKEGFASRAVSRAICSSSMWVWNSHGSQWPFVNGDEQTNEIEQGQKCEEKVEMKQFGFLIKRTFNVNFNFKFEQRMNQNSESEFRILIYD